MANQTVTTSQTLESVIAGGLNDGENITINSGAVVTCTETPSKLIARVTVNDGTFLIDGTSITTGNIINFMGEGGFIDGSNDETITVLGAGLFKTTGAWFDIGTTDGTDNQVIDLSVATGVGYWDKSGVDFCPHSIPMIQVETGRRINYSGEVGTAPVVGDVITQVSDRTVMGKIVSIGAGFVVVDLLTVPFVGGEAIQIRKVVDNVGADLQQTWIATVNGADVKEAGVYKEFGNSRSDSVSYISAYGSGYGGLVFDNAYASTSLTFGGSIGGGFVPPTGCNIRVPNINIGTSDLVNYPLNNAMTVENSNETEWYSLECSAAGSIDLSITNIGGAYFYDSAAFAFDAEYVGTVLNMGSAIASGRLSFNHCVAVQDPVGRAEPAIFYFGGCQDLVSGADITNCMIVNSLPKGLAFGGLTSFNIDVSDCIHTNAGQGTALDTNAVHGYYFNIVNTGTCLNNMYFGNDHAEQDDAIRVSNASDITIKNFQHSMTQDYTAQSQEKNTVYMSNTTTSYIDGIEVIGGGVTGNYMVRYADCIDAKIRAIGMIDDKIPFGSDGEYLVGIEGVCNNIDVARCWKSGGVTEEAVNIALSCKNITVQNTSGDYASELQPSGATAIRFKGVHGGSGTYGGSTGWEDAYASSFGNSFHDGFQSDTNGSIACLMITPSATSNETTTISGSPKFFKDGDLDMANLDVIEFEQSYFAKGHTGFTGNYTAASGTAGYFANEWSNVDLDFQYALDDGAGFNGTWLDVRTPANLTTISGAIEEGIKFKFRFTATGTQANMSALLLESTTTLTAQKDNFYPIDQIEYTLTLTGLEVGTDVVILDAGTDTVLASVDQTSGSTFQYTYQTLDNFDVGIIKQGFVTQYIYGFTPSASDANLPIKQVVDRNYKT